MSSDIAREKVVQQAAQVDVKMLNHVETEEKSQLPTQTGNSSLWYDTIFIVSLLRFKFAFSIFTCGF